MPKGDRKGKAGLLSDPSGWAEKVVGTRRNYLLMISMQLFWAAIMTIIAGIASSLAFGYVKVGIVLTVFIAMLGPLTYLHAMRSLVVERVARREREDAGEAGAQSNTPIER